VPTNANLNDDPQSAFLSAVRESQAAVIDAFRAWTDLSQQVTRNLPVPVAASDVAGAVDRVFDLAEQTLAAQRQLALTLAGVATRQVDTAMETVSAAAVETLDTTVAAVDSTVETLQTTVTDAVDAVDELEQRVQERADQPAAGAAAAPKAEPPERENRADRRSYEERSVDELRDRARELDIEGRSAMNKDELVATLRDQRQPRPARRRQQPAKQESKPDRRSYEERSVEELRERARELEIEGRSTMSKDELVAALRKHSK
jgi:hypothetical protein